MDVKIVNTREILKDFSFRFSDRKDLSLLTASIKNSGLIAPPCAVEKQEGFKLISGFSRFEASINAGLNSIPLRIIPDNTPIFHLFYNEIEVHSVNRKFTLTEKARILKIVMELDTSDKELAAICELIDLPEERGVITKVVEILNFTDDVRKYIGMYDLSLRQTVMFKGLTDQEQTIFTDLAKRMQVRSVELSKIVEIVKDISYRDGKPVEQIIKSAELNKPDSHENRNQALAHFKDELQKLRFPALYGINIRLIKERKAFKSSGLLKLEWDRTLENPGLYLSANIRSTEDVDTILSAVSNENNKKILSRMLRAVVP